MSISTKLCSRPLPASVAPCCCLQLAAEGRAAARLFPRPCRAGRIALVAAAALAHSLHYAALLLPTRLCATTYPSQHQLSLSHRFAFRLRWREALRGCRSVLYLTVAACGRPVERLRTAGPPRLRHRLQHLGWRQTMMIFSPTRMGARCAPSPVLSPARLPVSVLKVSAPGGRPAVAMPNF